MPPLLASFLVAQSAHETATSAGAWTSPVFVDCHNGFGYTTPTHYGTGACANHTFYAAYTSLINSVHELTARDGWIARRQADGSFPLDLNNITTIDQYAQLLKNAGYYGDTVQNYTAGLIYWLNRVGNNLVRSSATPVILAVLLLGAIVYTQRRKLFHTGS